MGIVDRVILLSHLRFHLENLNLVEILLKNDYTLKFIFNTINSWLKFLLSKSSHCKIDNNKEKNC